MLEAGRCGNGLGEGETTIPRVVTLGEQREGSLLAIQQWERIATESQEGED